MPVIAPFCLGRASESEATTFLHPEPARRSETTGGVKHDDGATSCKGISHPPSRLINMPSSGCIPMSNP